MSQKSLIVVESPSKARTIEQYLDGEFEVVACVGHVKDLPTSKLGIDIENNFEIKKFYTEINFLTDEQFEQCEFDTLLNRIELQNTTIIINKHNYIHKNYLI